MPEPATPTLDFLNTLWEGKPAAAAVQIWMRTDKSVTWHVADLEEASRLVTGRSHDVYMGCGLSPRAKDKPTRTRLKASEIVGIPGVWADIDVNGGPDSKAGAAPDRDSALELASALLEPTVLVNSGYGVQAWWCLEGGPWIFHDRAEQDQAARLVAGYQGALRAAARRAGWGLDATQDLARVMRIPGAMNHKGAEPVPVELIYCAGKTYHVDEIAELGQGFDAVRDHHDNSLPDVSIPDRPGIDSRVLELLQGEPEFKALWEMKRGASGGKRTRWTPSEFELSICNWLVRAGLSDQELAEAIACWRLSIDPGDPRGKVRADRIARTIGKVRSTIVLEDEKERIETVQVQVAETMEKVNKGHEPPNEAKVLGLFNQLIGGPEIARLKQHSRDPEFARFSIELADGREISLGRFEKLADEREFRKVYAIATGYFPPSCGAKKWETAVGALLKIAVVSEDTDASVVGLVGAWLRSYYQATGSTDKDGACAVMAPFVREGDLHVHAGHMLKWLKRTQGERIENADLIHKLRLCGFDRRTVNYKLDAGDTARSSRSYYVCYDQWSQDEQAA